MALCSPPSVSARIVFALIEPSHGLIAGTAGIVALISFFFVERRSQAPMLSFDLFRSRNFSGANLLTLFFYTALGGVLFFFPLNLIQIQGYSATEAGAALLPFILLMFVLFALVRRISRSSTAQSCRS